MADFSPTGPFAFVAFDTAVTYRLGAPLAKSFHRTFFEGFILQLRQQLELVHEDLDQFP